MSSATADVATQGASVLVVDDEEVIRALLTSSLSSAGYDVTAVDSGEVALALVRERKFELAIVDVGLPGMNGVDTLRALKALNPDMEVVVATGDTNVKDAVESLKHGAYDYIGKPFCSTELRHTLDRAIRHGELRSTAALFAATQKLLGWFERQDFAALAVEQAYDLFGADVIALVGLEQDIEPPVKVTAAPELTARIIDTLSDLARSDKRITRYPEDLRWSCESYRSGLALPLVARDRCLGVLVALRGNALPAFNRADERTAGLYATQLALALENRRLFDELSGSVRELRVLHGRIQRSRARVKAVLNLARDGILILAADGSIRQTNRTAETLFGIGQREMRGRPFSTLVADLAVRQRIDAILKGSGTSEELTSDPFVETTAVRADGTEFPVELAISCTLVADRLLVTAFVRDLTDRRRMEVELRHAQKLESVGMLASGIAHEINTPIQYIGDNVNFLGDVFRDLSRTVGEYEALRREVVANEIQPETMERLDAVRTAVDLSYLLAETPACIEQTLVGVGRVATIVRAMKDFAHPDTRSMQQADLNRSIATTLVVARNEVDRSADVETDFGELPAVSCYVGDLNQVFLNLVVNAAQAIGAAAVAGARGRIHIQTRCVDQEVEIRIADDGPGIPQEYRERVFDPFFTTKEVGKGTGQGLAIARSIVVDKHGGKITVESEVGRGTTFIVHLPVGGKKSEGEL